MICDDGDRVGVGLATVLWHNAVTMVLSIDFTGTVILYSLKKEVFFIIHLDTYLHIIFFTLHYIIIFYLLLHYLYHHNGYFWKHSVSNNIKP